MAKSETDKTMKLEQKLGKLQYERMQLEAQIAPMQKRFNELTGQIVEVANEIATVKRKKKETPDVGK